jgi:hypothetical protein
MKELLFIDIETTAKHGPEAGLDGTIEIAASKLNLETREVTPILDTLVIPSMNGMQIYLKDQLADDQWILGDYHVKAKHFEGTDWSAGLELRDVLTKLAPAMEGATIAGQNPHFDLRYLRRDFIALGLQYPKTDYHVIDLCSPAIFLHMNGLIPGISLRHSGPWAGCTKQAHRAGQDVQDAIQVFWKMRDYFDPRSYIPRG